MRWFLVAIAVGCTPVETTTPVESRAPAVQSPTSPHGLQMSIRAPSRAAYHADLLGTEPERVEITFANGGDEAIDLSTLNVELRARRNGKPIACTPFHPPPERSRERVAPHASVVVERELCSLPVLGAYDVDAVASLAHEEPITATFHVEVAASSGNVPAAIAGHPDWFAAMGATFSRLPFTVEEWKSGAFHIALRVTNTSDKDAALGVAHVTFRVTKDQKPLECSDTRDVTLPRVIAAGHTTTVAVPVTCVVDVQGHYDIRAELALDPDPTPTPLGSFHVEITSDPLIFLPILPY